jgi:hypothetical protein
MGVLTRVEEVDMVSVKISVFPQAIDRLERERLLSTPETPNRYFTSHGSRKIDRSPEMRRHQTNRK